jgi:hypothetical protein
MVVLYWFVFLLDMMIPRFVTDEVYLEDGEYYDVLFRWKIVMDEFKYENNCAIKSLNIFGLGFFPTFYDLIYEEDIS